jgi:hypothetical protein
MMQGFAAVTPAVSQWLELLCVYLEKLGPVPVEDFSPDAVEDDLVATEAR